MLIYYKGNKINMSSITAKSDSLPDRNALLSHTGRFHCLDHMCQEAVIYSGLKGRIVIMQKSEVDVA